MSHPTEEQLVDLAVGDAAADSISAHLDTCTECADAVAELRRTAHLLASGPAHAGWQAPAESVWARISEQLSDDHRAPRITEELGRPTRIPPTTGAPAAPHADQAAPTSGATSPAAPAVAPEAPPVAPPLRPEGTAERATPEGGDELAIRRGGAEASGGGGRRFGIGWGVGLAAASLAIGLLAGRAIWQPEASVQPVAQVALSTLDTKQDEGKATIVRSGQGLDLTVATTKPLDAGNGFLEVWLINADGKRMVSVGVLPQGESGSFPISQTLIDQGYVIVDISREKFDDSPTHSGDSLLRGKLPA